MPHDVYAPCPGGTGKKVKFCCADSVADLEKVERMIDGQQYQAALALVERLIEKRSDRACTLALRCELLSRTNRHDEAGRAAADFLKQFPDNPMAAAESALALGLEGKGSEALPLIVNALASAPEVVPKRLYELLAVMTQILLLQGQVIPGLALLQVMADMNPKDESVSQRLAEVLHSREVPLWVKTAIDLHPCPASAPWRAEFDACFAPLATSQWQKVVENLSALAAKVGEQPAIWLAIGTLRSWMGDAPGAIAAWERFAAMDVPLDDAVETQALAYWLTTDPLGDPANVLSLLYEVQDVQRTEMALGSSPRLMPYQGNLAEFVAEGEPPPKAAWYLFDHPLQASAADLTPLTVPNLVGRAMLFGRQTDKPARLIVEDVVMTDAHRVRRTLTEIGGLAFESEEVTGRVSASSVLLARKWRVPEDTTRNQFQDLLRGHLDEAILRRWPEAPLGVLAGKTPRQAAADPRWRVKLLAAILYLEYFAGRSGARYDFNRLRSELGLPALEPLELAGDVIRLCPPLRLTRLVPEKLSDDDLMLAFSRAEFYSVLDAALKFAAEWLRRPSLANHPEQLKALAFLVNTSDDLDEALQLYQQARRSREVKGRLCALLDILEVSLRIRRGEAEELGRVIDHVQRQHQGERDLLAALGRMLVEHGLLAPDGRPWPEADAPEEPSIVVPGGAAEAGKLWTPDGDKPAGEKPSLWIPGAE